MKKSTYEWTHTTTLPLLFNRMLKIRQEKSILLIPTFIRTTESHSRLKAGIYAPEMTEKGLDLFAGGIAFFRHPGARRQDWEVSRGQRNLIAMLATFIQAGSWHRPGQFLPEMVSISPSSNCVTKCIPQCSLCPLAMSLQQAYLQSNTDLHRKRRFCLSDLYVQENYILGG